MGMWIVIDVVLAAFVVIGLIIGLKRGFIRSVESPLRFVGALASAYLLANPVSVGIIEPIVGASLTNQLSEYLKSNCSNPDAELPTIIKLAAQIVNVDLEGKTIEQIIVDIASPTVHVVTVIIVFFILFFISKLLFKLLFKLLDMIFNSTLLVIPNKIVGCVMNALLGAVFAWIAVFVFNFIIHLDSMSEVVWAAEFEGGPIYNFFLNLSPLDLLLGF
jgi:uncharacterized membrane protein required for colicin V production